MDIDLDEGRITSGDAEGFLDELEANATADGWTPMSRTGGDGPTFGLMLEW